MLPRLLGGGTGGGALPRLCGLCGTEGAGGGMCGRERVRSSGVRVETAMEWCGEAEVAEVVRVEPSPRRLLMMVRGTALGGFVAPAPAAVAAVIAVAEAAVGGGIAIVFVLSLCLCVLLSRLCL